LRGLPRERPLDAPCCLPAALCPACRRPGAGRPAIEELPLATLSGELASGATTSEAATRAYLARIAAMDRKGPKLRSIIALNPDALAEAKAADARRRAGHALGPLDGVPILIKDNIETKDPIATTAGSLALKDNITHRDAPVIALLRGAGAVILGKTNLSEWANIRSNHSLSGWSAVGRCATPMPSIARPADLPADRARRWRPALPPRRWARKRTGRWCALPRSTGWWD
jgi:hypothetical protein